VHPEIVGAGAFASEAGTPDSSGSGLGGPPPCRMNPAFHSQGDRQPEGAPLVEGHYLQFKREKNLSTRGIRRTISGQVHALRLPEGLGGRHHGQRR